MKYRSGKTYGHERGLSCCFRQWKADSHCSLLHGYALSVHIEFEAHSLDDRNWVIDFGAMKAIKEWLDHMFDHTTIVASDDPQAEHYVALSEKGMINLRMFPAVGCEAFAQEIATFVDRWLLENDHKPRVWLDHVTVREHGANSATIIWEEQDDAIEE